MKIRIIQLCLGTFLGITTLQAQQQVILTEYDGKIIKTKVGREKKEKIIVDNTWAIKFDVVKLIRSELNFSFEKKMTDRFSLEYGAGFTVSEVGFFSNFHYYNSSGMEARSNLGFLASISARYYPMESYKVFNRFYVAPTLKYTNFNTDYIITSNEVSTTMKGFENKGSFTFNFGIQSWLSDTFAIDYYVGLGLGFNNQLYYSNNYNGSEYAWEKKRRSRANYVFTTGLKVAIGN